MLTAGRVELVIRAATRRGSVQSSMVSQIVEHSRVEPFRRDICYHRVMLNPTPRERMVDAQGRPYFLWDCDLDLETFQERLRDPDPAVRAYFIGKLMRQAKPDDVFQFVSLLSKTAWTPIGGARGMGLEGPDLARIGAEVSMVLNGSCPRRSRSAAAAGLDEEPPVAFRRACPATP
jgi:hypothetical protein